MKDGGETKKQELRKSEKKRNATQQKLTTKKYTPTFLKRERETDIEKGKRYMKKMKRT